jgi:branched-chain amino acid transport system permease protein
LLDAEQVSALRFIIIGSALILIIRFRPEGLLPEKPQRPAEAASSLIASKGSSL